MGQRLNIEITDGEKTLANSYYHWPAYSGRPFVSSKKLFVRTNLRNQFGCLISPLNCCKLREQV